MGRPQHRVRNSSSESRLLEEDVGPPCWVRFHSRGGRDDEQARQSGAIVLEFRDMGVSVFPFPHTSKPFTLGSQFMATLPATSLGL